MTPEDAAQRLMALQEGDDPKAPQCADVVIADFLRALGHGVIVDEWEKAKEST